MSTEETEENTEIERLKSLIAKNEIIDEVEIPENLDKYLKIVHISDSHSTFHSEAIPDGDILICSGDFSSYYEWMSNDRSKTVLSPSVKLFDGMMSKLSHNLKFVIAGNHDVLDAFDINHVVEKMFKNCIYLMDNLYTINVSKTFPRKIISDEYQNLNIYGSPWNYHPGMAYGKSRRGLPQFWEKIPIETDILVTHVPPRFVLDKNPFGKSCGCEHLLCKTQELSGKHRLRLHCFGHVHDSKGIVRLPKESGVDIVYSNGSEKLRNISKPNVIYFKISD